MVLCTLQVASNTGGIDEGTLQRSDKGQTKVGEGMKEGRGPLLSNNKLSAAN